MTWAAVPDPTVGDVARRSGTPWLTIGSTWVVVVVGAVVFAVALALVVGGRRG